MFAYDFDTNIVPGTMPYEEEGYWRDVGTIASFFNAHMDMLGEFPRFDLGDKLWPIHPASYEGPATKILSGEIKNSIISEGVVIRNARIVNSVIRRDVIVEEDASIEESIIMDHTVISKGCRLRRVIVDKFNTLAEREEIGFDPDADRRKCRCHLDPSGIAVIAKGERTVRKSHGHTARHEDIRLRT